MRARRFVQACCFATVMAFAAGSADAAAKPKGATAKCSDGTYSMAKTHRGACTGHGGVETWYKEPKEDKESKEAKVTKEPTKVTKEPTKVTKEPTKVTKEATKESKTEAKAEKRSEKSESKAEKKSYPVDTAGSAARPQPRPSDAPGTATAQCNDGSYSYAKHHQGACSGHHGVKTWYK